ncbi:MAG: hypothetical protein Q8P10_00935 [bacterium]|nr:hypothetical protein [bacterium]
MDEVSFGAMGLKITRADEEEFIHIHFPPELRAAFLVYSFDFWRRGQPLPSIQQYDDSVILYNGVIRAFLKTMARYLEYYETELKKRDPKASLNAQTLLTYLFKYIKKIEENIKNN